MWRIEPDPVNRYDNDFDGFWEHGNWIGDVEGVHNKYNRLEDFYPAQRLRDPFGGVWPLQTIGAGANKMVYEVRDEWGAHTNIVLKHILGNEDQQATAPERMQEFMPKSWRIEADKTYLDANYGRTYEFELQERVGKVQDVDGSLMTNLLARFKQADLALKDFHYGQFGEHGGELKIIDTDTATTWEARDSRIDEVLAGGQEWEGGHKLVGQWYPEEPGGVDVPFSGAWGNNRRIKVTPVPDPIQDVRSDVTPRVTKSELFASGELTRKAALTESKAL